jgi:hypothetical protein
VADAEEVTGEARRLERVWLGLRTDRGIAWSELGAPALALAERWIESGWAWRERRPGGDRLRLGAEGWLLLDRLAVELDAGLGATERVRPAVVRGGVSIV